MTLVVKSPPANAGDIRDAGLIPGSGRSPGQEDPLEKEMATHFSIPAWRIPWKEEPGRLYSVGSQSQTQLKRLSARIEDDDREHFNQRKSLDKYPAWQPTSSMPGRDFH